VVDKLVIEIEAQLEQKSVTLSMDDAARSWIAVRGYDPKMGARPMARVLQEHVKRPLAEELLFGRLAGGGSVRVSLAAGRNLTLDIRPAKSPGCWGRTERASPKGHPLRTGRVRPRSAVDDAAFREVVGREFHGDRVARQDPDVVLAHLPGDVRSHDVIVLQFHAEGRIGQGLDDLALHLDCLFLRHHASSIRRNRADCAARHPHTQ
jgi:hypothetical protein